MKRNHPKAKANLRTYVPAALIAGMLLNASCSLPEPVEASAPLCGTDTEVADLDRDRDDGAGSVTVLILHVAPDHAFHDKIADVVARAAHGGHKLVAWRLESSNAANLRSLDKWDLAGTARNSSRLRDEIQQEAEAATCDLLAMLEQPTDGDKGADLTGALTQVMRTREVIEATGTAQITLLTEGGVHRTNQLDLGNPETEPEAWQATVEVVADVAASISESVSLDIEIEGVGVARDSISDAVRQNTAQFWDETCEALKTGGVQCSRLS